MVIEYKGYVVSQSEYNHHVMLSQDGHMVFHANTDKPMTEEELRQYADQAIELMDSFFKNWEDDDGT